MLLGPSDCDADATDDKVHGDQEMKAFNAYYDSYCFQPLYVFSGDQLLVSYLRPANLGDAHHAPGITKLLVTKIRQRWPIVKIILRGDGGFAIERLMRWCDKNDVHYIFGLPKNQVLVAAIACEMTRARIVQSRLGGKQACFKWFRYRTRRTWDRHRWVVGKAEYTDKGPNPRFVVTNLFSNAGIVDTTYHRPMVDGKKQPIEVDTPGTRCSVAFNPERFYREWYCIRGEMENRIKKQQLCLFADRTSCSSFPANQFRGMLSTFAHVLVDAHRYSDKYWTIYAEVVSGTNHIELRCSETKDTSGVGGTALQRCCLPRTSAECQSTGKIKPKSQSTHHRMQYPG